jgi:sec-independent protein translocase protein TatC
MADDSVPPRTDGIIEPTYERPPQVANSVLAPDTSGEAVAKTVVNDPEGLPTPSVDLMKSEDGTGPEGVTGASEPKIPSPGSETPPHDYPHETGYDASAGWASSERVPDPVEHGGYAGGVGGGGSGTGDSAGTDEEDEGGGPVKTFLEHLEDLRWTIVKCAVAIALGVLVCLSAGKQIIEVIKWPLEKAKKFRTTDEPRVVLTLGTNFFGSSPRRIFPLAGAATNSDTFYKLEPIQVGAQTVLGLVVDTNPPASAVDQMRVDLKTYSPGGGFTIAMQIAIFGGMTLSAPFVLFFLGQFILPAMHMHEKRFLYRVSGFASLLFFLGIAFCYFVMLPITFSTTTAFSNWLGFGADEWKADEYISFTCWFLLGMGASFQLPLVLLTLVKLGLLTAAQLNQFRMYWVVAGLVIAGFVTPDGNPLTMLLMFAPLHLLYEISVIIAWMWGRKSASAVTEV